MSGAAADPKTSETACSKFLGNAKGASTLPHALGKHAHARHKTSLPCVNPYSLIDDRLFLAMGTTGFYRAVLHDLRVVTFH